MTLPETKETSTTPSITDNIKTGYVSESPEEDDIAKKVQQRMKFEAHLTSGCGHGKKKTQLLEAFWSIMWKELERIGWRKIEGTGDEEGSITFFPPKLNSNMTPSLTKERGRRGKDYYDRIKDVIDRILEGHNEEEKKIADLYSAEFSDDEVTRLRTSRRSVPTTTLSTSTPEKGAASKRGRLSLTGNTIDLSWKDGGSLYPKRSSQVGDEFQATDIPPAGSYTRGAHSDLYELVWDPNGSNNARIEQLLKDEVPTNKKEQALFALGLLGLQGADNLTQHSDEVLNQLRPVDGSDWTVEDKEKFHTHIFRLRKDMASLAKALGKDLKSCITYYLGSYKKSDHYRLLKTVCTEERMESATSNVHGVDACAVCGEGGSLLICDGCELEYHMSCLRPKLVAVPEGHWECDECVDKNLLKTRDYIIAHSRLYQPYQGNSKKRKVDETSNDCHDTDGESTADDIILRPSSPVMAAIKAFAREVDAIFCRGGSSTATPAPS